MQRQRPDVSLSILHRVGTTSEEREEYVKFAPWKGEKEGEPSLSADRYAEMELREQFILTVCANGYGKMSSAYEYRRTGRGGQGITNIDNIERNGPVVASFPASKADQLMLVTDQAKLIRLPLESLRVIGRGSAGVRLFNVANDEHVVSAVRLVDDGLRVRRRPARRHDLGAARRRCDPERARRRLGPAGGAFPLGLTEQPIGLAGPSCNPVHISLGVVPAETHRRMRTGLRKAGIAER